MNLQKDDVCWICLEASGCGPDGVEAGVDGVSDVLRRMPCGERCRQRWAHPRCVARWQLQSAGTRRETHCEFCNELLPDWKSVFTPRGPIPDIPATMTVSVDGIKQAFVVTPGPDGLRQFQTALKAAYLVPEECQLEVAFVCRDPITQSKLVLSGEATYDAAVFCAWLSAVRRSGSHDHSSSSRKVSLLERTSTGASPGLVSDVPIHAVHQPPSAGTSPTGISSNTTAPKRPGLRQRLSVLLSELSCMSIDP